MTIKRKHSALAIHRPTDPQSRNLLPLMNATKIKFLKNDMEFVELADNVTRLKALHIYFLLTGAYTPKEQITQEATTVRAIVLGAQRPQPQLPESKNGDTK